MSSQQQQNQKEGDESNDNKNQLPAATLSPVVAATTNLASPPKRPPVLPLQSPDLVKNESPFVTAMSALPHSPIILASPTHKDRSKGKAYYGDESSPGSPVFSTAHESADVLVSKQGFALFEGISSTTGLVIGIILVIAAIIILVFGYITPFMDKVAVWLLFVLCVGIGGLLVVFSVLNYDRILTVDKEAKTINVTTQFHACSGHETQTVKIGFDEIKALSIEKDFLDASDDSDVDDSDGDDEKGGFADLAKIAATRPSDSKQQEGEEGENMRDDNNNHYNTKKKSSSVLDANAAASAAAGGEGGAEGFELEMEDLEKRRELEDAERRKKRKKRMENKKKKKQRQLIMNATRTSQKRNGGGGGDTHSDPGGNNDDSDNVDAEGRHTVHFTHERLQRDSKRKTAEIRLYFNNPNLDENGKPKPEVAGQLSCSCTDPGPFLQDHIVLGKHLSHAESKEQLSNWYSYFTSVLHLTNVHIDPWTIHLPARKIEAGQGGEDGSNQSEQDQGFVTRWQQPSTNEGPCSSPRCITAPTFFFVCLTIIFLISLVVSETNNNQQESAPSSPAPANASTTTTTTTSGAPGVQGKKKIVFHWEIAGIIICLACLAIWLSLAYTVIKNNCSLKIYTNRRRVHYSLEPVNMWCGDEGESEEFDLDQILNLALIDNPDIEKQKAKRRKTKEAIAEKGRKELEEEEEEKRKQQKRKFQQKEEGAAAEEEKEGNENDSDEEDEDDDDEDSDLYVGENRLVLRYFSDNDKMRPREIILCPQLGVGRARALVLGWQEFFEAKAKIKIPFENKTSKSSCSSKTLIREHSAGF